MGTGSLSANYRQRKKRATSVDSSRTSLETVRTACASTVWFRVTSRATVRTCAAPVETPRRCVASDAGNQVTPWRIAPIVLIRATCFRYTATCAVPRDTCVARRKTRCRRACRAVAAAEAKATSIRRASTPVEVLVEEPRQTFRVSTAASAGTSPESVRRTPGRMLIFRERRRRSTLVRAVAEAVGEDLEAVDAVEPRRTRLRDTRPEDTPPSTAAGEEADGVVRTGGRQTLVPRGEAWVRAAEVLLLPHVGLEARRIDDRISRVLLVLVVFNSLCTYVHYTRIRERARVDVHGWYGGLWYRTSRARHCLKLSTSRR